MQASSSLETSQRPEDVSSDSVPRQPDFGQVKKEVRSFLEGLSVLDFINPTKPWILVPNGSFMGFFDFVPSIFREGPWSVFTSMYIVGAIYVVVLGAVYNYSLQDGGLLQDLPRGYYYKAFTMPWYLNLAGFLWTAFVYRDLFVSGLGLASMVTFTVQSYTYIMLRFFLSTLAPFCPSYLAVVNELLRYPVLSQGTITFVVWNFILAPVIFLCIQDEEKRKSFINYFTNFRLTQLHFFHMFLAAYSGLLGTPARPLLWTDLYASMTLGLAYCLFYILILDRLGIHLYLIFSPRTNLAILTWTMLIATTVGLYPIWSGMIERYGGYWDDEMICHQEKTLSWEDGSSLTTTTTTASNLLNYSINTTTTTPA